MTDTPTTGRRGAHHVPAPSRRLELWLPLSIVVDRPDRRRRSCARRCRCTTASRSCPGCVDFTHVQNSGAAFGILNGVDFPFKTAVIALIATAALVGVGLYAASLAHHQLRRAHRPRAHHRRRGRQPARPHRRGLGRRLRGRLLAHVSFLGVQRRGLGHHDRRRDHDSRHARRRRRMHPRLFELGPLTVYTYGVLLAAAYLLGLKLAMVRAETRGLDATRVLDLGIYIIISALVGAKLLLLVTDFRTFTADPRELLTLVRSGGVFYGGLILAVAVALWYIRRVEPAAVDDVRRVRAGHRARPRRRPLRLLLRRLLLRQADDDAVGRSRSPIRSRRPTSARRSACRCTRRSSTRRAPSSLILLRPARDRAAGARLRRAGRSGSTCCSTRSRASSSRSTAATRARHASACSRPRSSSRSCSRRSRSACSCYLSRRRRGAGARTRAQAEESRVAIGDSSPARRFTVSDDRRGHPPRSVPRVACCRAVAIADPAAHQGRARAGRRRAARRRTSR